MCAQSWQQSSLQGQKLLRSSYHPGIEIVHAFETRPFESARGTGHRVLSKFRVFLAHYDLYGASVPTSYGVPAHQEKLRLG